MTDKFLFDDKDTSDMLASLSSPSDGWECDEVRWDHAEDFGKLAKYSDDQPRDDHGRWTFGGGPAGQTFQKLAEQTRAQVLKDRPKFLAEAIKLQPDLNNLMASAANYTEWRDWYDRHRDLIKEVYGPQNELMFERFLAATSINAGVQTNLDRAIRAFNHYLGGGSFATEKDYAGILPVVRHELMLIEKEAPPSKGAPKVNEFSAALRGDAASVTVDRWMARALFTNPRDPPIGSQHEVARRIITAFADKMGWKPSELQAVIWTAKVQAEGQFKPTDYGKELLRNAANTEQTRAASIRAFMKANPSYYKSVDVEKLNLPLQELEQAHLNLAMLLLFLAGLSQDDIHAFEDHPETSIVKYSPDQPRNPAGSPEGGEFASGDAGPLAAVYAKMSNEEWKSAASKAFDEKYHGKVTIGERFDVSPTLRAPLMREIMRLQDSYPLPEGVQITYATQFGLVGTRSYAATDWALHGSFHPVVSLNPTFFASPVTGPDYLTTGIQHDLDTRWHDGMRDPGFVLAHEYGHVMESALYHNFNPSSPVMQAMSNYEKIDSGLRSDPNRLVSGYAAVNPSEGFAEAFAVMDHGDAEARGHSSVKAMREIMTAYKASLK